MDSTEPAFNGTGCALGLTDYIDRFLSGIHGCAWSTVFEVVDFVMREALVRNMRVEAIDIIVDYIGLYSGY